MKKIYAVRQGRQTGIFNTWADCEAQVKGYAGASYKGFTDAGEAMAWLQGGAAQMELFAAPRAVRTTRRRRRLQQDSSSEQRLQQRCLPIM
jgi:ribonuclease HI